MNRLVALVAILIFALFTFIDTADAAQNFTTIDETLAISPYGTYVLGINGSGEIVGSCILDWRIVWSRP